MRKGITMTTAASPAKASPDSRTPTDTAENREGIRRMANAIRALAMDAVEAAKSGHPGMPMGMADVATVLFTRHLKFDPAESRLARPRPLRAVRRSRVDAALCAALSDGLSRDHDRRHQALPPARQSVRRASGIRPCARHRDDDGPSRPGPRQCRRHGAGRAHPERARSAMRWSITAPMSSPATAI